MPYEPTSWKKPTSFEFTTPSGQTCLMKNIDLQAFMLDGNVENIDVFTQFVDQTYVKPKGPKAPDDHKSKKKSKKDESTDDGFMLAEMVKSGDFNKLLKLIDAAVVTCVIEPKVHADPADPKDRDSDLVYTSDIDLMDKMAIFTRGMEGINKLKESDFRPES